MGILGLGSRRRVVSALVLLLLSARSARAERIEALPGELEGIGITEKIGAALPVSTRFVDDRGEEVALGDYFRSGRPVILTLNYSNCPMLCSIQLTELVKTLRQVDWTAGEEFEVVTVSLDPAEPPARARQTKERYLEQYGRPQARQGWHFLTGSEASIRAVADAAGFGYRYSPERNEYLHAAALILVGGEGRIARYLYGLLYEPQTLRLSLRETADGKQVSAIDQLILYCFHYDAEKGRYAPAARNLMRLGGGVTVAALALGVGGFFWRERRRKSRAAAGAHDREGSS